MRRRRGGGLIGTMARTAVIAGTATATVGAVQGHQQRKADSRAQEQMAQDAAFQSQQELEQMKAQMAQMQAQQAQAAVAPQTVPAPAAPPASSGDDPIAKLTKLNELKLSGALTEEEFQAAKTKILGL